MKSILILTLASLASSLSIPSTNQKPLDGSYLNVEFYPLVRSVKNEQELNYSYTKEDLTTLLDLTSTRFHKLTIFAGYKTLPVGYNSTLKLVAKWNKAQVLNGKSLSISIYDLGIPDDPDDILNVISEANAIYPGTVDQVILNLSVKKIDFVTNLVSFREKLHKLNVKLGIQFNYYACDLFDEVKWVGASKTGEFPPQQLPNSITLPNTTRLILNNADFAIFNMPAILDPSFISREPKETVDYQNEQFALCEDAVLRALDKPISVHMKFVWFSRGKGFYNTPSYLSTVWKLLGDKAVKEKKDVFVDGAFDTPFLEVDFLNEKIGLR